MSHSDFLSKVYELLGFGPKENTLKRRSDTPKENVASSPKCRRFDDISGISMRNLQDNIFLEPSQSTLFKRKFNDHNTLDTLFKRDISSLKVPPYADREFSDDDDDVTIEQLEKPFSTNFHNISSRNKKRKSNIFLKSFTGITKPKIRNIPIQIERKPPPLISARSRLLSNSGLPPLQPIRRSAVNGHSMNNTTEKMNGFGSPGADPKLFYSSPKTNLNMNGPESSVMDASPKLPSSLLKSNSREAYQKLLSHVESDGGNLAALLLENQNFLNGNLRRSSLNKSSPASKVVEIVNLVDDDDIIPKETTIDLSSDDVELIAVGQRTKAERKKLDENATKKILYVEPINSLKCKLELVPSAQESWLKNFAERYSRKHKDRAKEITERAEDVRRTSEETREQEKLLQERMKDIKICHETIILDEPEEPEEEEFPELTDEQFSLVQSVFSKGANNDILIKKFNQTITRRDIYTLYGTNWLNDEVINFYMNLLVERSEKCADMGLPRVYAMNTFFLQKLIQSGHDGVRRWTRKVDIYSYDVIPVPVHVGGVHWCMAIIHLKNKTIKYYDSMGTPNPKVLNALEQYLIKESLDKRKQSFDTSAFQKDFVADCPRQMNGSDCGVFSCMFAEYITRNREITFSQENMQYFRQKMILEIIQGRLLLP